MSGDLPVVGAAMPVEELSTYRDWLFEKDRDVEIQSFTRHDVLESDWSALTDEACRQLDGHKGRRGIHGPFWGLLINSMDPDIQTVVRKRVMQALDVCEALSASQMVLHSPHSAWTHNNFGAVPGWREGIITSTQATLGPCVARAEDIGVTLVIENIEDVDPAARLELAESFGSPNVRLSVDTGHAHVMRGIGGAPPVDYFIRGAGAHLAHVHLQDVDGFADRHWSLGEGTIQWHSVFEALAAIDANPHLILELRDYSKIPDSMAYLERKGLAQ